MGCYKSRCKFCKHTARGSDNLELMIRQGEHLEEAHKDIWNKNGKAEGQYKKDCKRILDKKLRNSVTPTFTPAEWDGEDYAD
ncbi:hypothetical protein LCGC14_2245100 [marine sediment metagenome]|uniref:Uncharacterized protein n=1 Tax=marine sediment metagenome TaxID=412755 RepID=A0A0F9D402_9ZZZZ